MQGLPPPELIKKTKLRPVSQPDRVLLYTIYMDQWLSVIMAPFVPSETGLK